MQRRGEQHTDDAGHDDARLDGARLDGAGAGDERACHRVHHGGDHRTASARHDGATFDNSRNGTGHVPRHRASLDHAGGDDGSRPVRPTAGPRDVQ